MLDRGYLFPVRFRRHNISAKILAHPHGLWFLSHLENYTRFRTDLKERIPISWLNPNRLHVQHRARRAKLQQVLVKERQLFVRRYIQYQQEQS
jgi:hypothetical protein